jgi:hypothetical protein
MATPMVDSRGYVLSGYFEGPLPKVARIARHLGLNPDRRCVRVGRSYRLQIGPHVEITAERYDEAVRLWESLS